MVSFRSDKLKASLHSKILHFLKVLSNLAHIMKVCFWFTKTVWGVLFARTKIVLMKFSAFWFCKHVNVLNFWKGAMITKSKSTEFYAIEWPIFKRYPYGYGHVFDSPMVAKSLSWRHIYCKNGYQHLCTTSSIRVSMTHGPWYIIHIVAW